MDYDSVCATIRGLFCNCDKAWDLECSSKRQTLMKPIEKDELYAHLSGFLKNKGVELKEGPYTKGIHAGCSLLADAINLSQAGLQRARDGVAKQINEVRQVIHEKTAPKPPRVAPNPKSRNSSGTTVNGASAKAQARKATKTQPKAPTANKKPKRRSKG